MASLNKVLLIGNLGRDPESRYLPSGGAVCNFSIATTERYKDKSGQQQEKTEWLNIVIYNKLADIAGQYLRKGSSVYLEGKIQTRKWQDKNTGADRYTTEIVCDQMQMLGSRQEQGGSQEQQAPRPAASKPAQSAGQEQPPSSNDFDDFGQDIPF